MGAGQCNTLAECQDACKDWAGCTAMNWWPTKGGCRLVKGATTSRTTEWTTISGGVDCTVSSTQPVAPSDSMCARRPPSSTTGSSTTGTSSSTTESSSSTLTSAS